MSFLPDYLFQNTFKFSYKGKDYFLLNFFYYNCFYEEEDNKIYFEIFKKENFHKIYLKKIYFNLEKITQLYHKHKKLTNKDLLYIDSFKLYEKFKSQKGELTEREVINYERIMEIPFYLILKNIKNIMKVLI